MRAMEDQVSEDRSWVEQLTKGTITRFDRATTGRSRATWLVDVQAPGGLLPLVLRRDTGDGPLSGTELSLAREQAVYRALAGTPVRIPRFLGASDDGLAVLVQRVPGEDDLAAAGDAAAQARVLDAFFDALAELHNVPVDELELPGFHRPADGPDHALGDLALWHRIFDGSVARPAPAVELAFRWLAANAPLVVERTVLCHGDAGPGNFLHDAGEVTALLDWEFAHLGDPMDDLAWVTVRASQLGGLTDLGPHLARYAAATGLTIDPDRVRYFQLLVLVRMAVACLVALGKPVGTMDVSTYHALLPLLERQITTRLAEELGVDVAPTELPAAAPPSPRAEILQALAADLGTQLLPELQTASARSRAVGMSLLLMHLQAADGLAAALEADQVADLAQVLGSGPADPAAAIQELAALAATAPTSQWPALVGPLSRVVDRRLALWPMVAGMAARTLPQVDAL